MIAHRDQKYDNLDSIPGTNTLLHIFLAIFGDKNNRINGENKAPITTIPSLCMSGCSEKSSSTCLPARELELIELDTNPDISSCIYLSTSAGLSWQALF